MRGRMCADGPGLYAVALPAAGPSTLPANAHLFSVRASCTDASFQMVLLFTGGAFLAARCTLRLTLGGIGLVRVGIGTGCSGRVRATRL